MASAVSGHTPGPWVVEEPMDHELWIVEAGKEAHEWRVIAGCPFPNEQGDISRKQVEANAQLIAAAPDMAKALIGLEGILATAESNASGNPGWAHVSSRINAARAALAKASLA